MVLSSHLMRDVERCTRYLVIMDQQKIKCQGYIRELCAGQANRYRLRVNGDHNQAARILQGRGYHVDNIHPRQPEFETLLDDGAQPRELFRILIDNDIQIRKLIPRHFTVEEIYKQHVDVGGEHE